MFILTDKYTVINLNQVRRIFLVVDTYKTESRVVAEYLNDKQEIVAVYDFIGGRRNESEQKAKDLLKEISNIKS